MDTDNYIKYNRAGILSSSSLLIETCRACGKRTNQCNRKSLLCPMGRVFDGQVIFI